VALDERFPRIRPDPRVLPKFPAGVSALAAGACVSAAGANDAPDGFVSVIVFLFCVLALTKDWERPRFVRQCGAHGYALKRKCRSGTGLPLFPSAATQKETPAPGANCILRLRGSAARLRPMDKFDEIFRMQDALNRRIGVALPPQTEEEKSKWILNYTRAMQQEIAELVDSVPWKWWAKYQKFDDQNARVEVVDLFHFLISLAQTLGMSAEDVFQAYVKKNQVNLQRQESGYVRKDESDSRHI
jgi:dimeric dUTPase (all-alpha-NTP-PPase superfamily)